MSTFVCLFQVLDLLWSLSHLPSLTTDMVDQALKSHIEILSDSYAVKEQIKKNYAVKCVEDIRKGVLIVPAIRQLLKITRGMVKQQFNKHDKVGTWLKNKILNTFFGGGGGERSTRTWNDRVHFFWIASFSFMSTITTNFGVTVLYSKYSNLRIILWGGKTLCIGLNILLSINVNHQQ